MTQVLSVVLKVLTVAQRCLSVILHWWPHPDEWLAYWIGIKFGKHIYPGIEKAPLKFWDAGTMVTPDGRPHEDWDNENFIAGVGVNVRKDEHGLPEEVRERHCAATLAAAELGVDKDPALRELLDALVRNDRHGHRTQFDMPAICWTLYFDGATPLEVQDIMFEWFDAIHEATSRKLANQPPVRPIGRPDLNEYLRLWIVGEYAYNASDEGALRAAQSASTALSASEVLGVYTRDEVGEILKLEDRKHTYGAATLLDIHTYVEMMHAAGHPEAHVRERVFRLLNAKRQEQKLFMAALDEVQPSAENCPVKFVQLWRDPRNPQKLIRVNSGAKEREQVLTAWAIGRRHTLVHEIAVIETDSLVAHKAVRYQYKTTLTIPPSGQPGSKEHKKEHKVEFKPDILVLRKPNRQTAIYLQRMPWRPIARRIRWEEYRRGNNAKVPVSMDVLMRTGNIIEEPRWCINDNGDNIQFLNGPLTAPNVPGSAQSLDTIVNEGIVAGIRFTYEGPQHHRPSGKPAPRNGRDRNRDRRSQPQTAKPATPGGEGFHNAPHLAAAPDPTPDSQE